MTAPNSISYAEAVQQLDDGQLAAGYEITFPADSIVKVAHALKLRKLGYTVPDSLIRYPDEMGEQIDDDDFDGDWQPVISGEADFMS